MSNKLFVDTLMVTERAQNAYNGDVRVDFSAKYLSLNRCNFPTGLPGTDNQVWLVGASGVGRWADMSGATGLMGPTGWQGMTGGQGDTGALGNTGAYGPTGFQGVTGIQGTTGAQGNTGTIGITGLQGFTGIQGITGLRGLLSGFTGVANISINGNDTNITTGMKHDFMFSYPFYIYKWTILSSITGSVEISLYKGSYAAYPPGVSGTMHIGATGPYVTNQIKNTGTTVGWMSATGIAGDTIRINVDSVTGVQRLTLALEYSL